MFWDHVFTGVVLVASMLNVVVGVAIAICVRAFVYLSNELAIELKTSVNRPEVRGSPGLLTL